MLRNENGEKENAKAHQEPSITDALSRNVDPPALRPVVNETEDAGSNRRSRSNGRASSNDVDPSPLLPVIEEEATNPSLAKIQITSPINNSLIADTQFEIIGSIERAELIREITVRYRGISENNISVGGEKNVNKTETNFSVVLDDLSDGDYLLA